MINKENALEIEKRRCIYQLILNNPGLHLREIFRKLNMSQGTIRHHLKYLHSRELITAIKDNGYKRFYVKNKIGIKEKDLFSLLRNEISQNIVLHLLINMASSVTRISEQLELTKDVVNYHLKKLLKSGIIEQVKVSNGFVNVKRNYPTFKKYDRISNEIVYILSDCFLIYDFFITYEKSFIKNPIAQDSLTWLKFIDGTKFPKVIKSDKKPDERFFDILYDIFPHPYYS